MRDTPHLSSRTLHAQGHPAFLSHLLPSERAVLAQLWSTVAVLELGLRVVRSFDSFL